MTSHGNIRMGQDWLVQWLCCLTIPNRYLSRCCRIIGKVQWYLCGGKFHRKYQSHQSYDSGQPSEAKPFSGSRNTSDELDSEPFTEAWQQGSWGQHRAHLGPTGPRRATCWPHELCYLGGFHLEVVVLLHMEDIHKYVLAINTRHLILILIWSIVILKCWSVTWLLSMLMLCCCSRIITSWSHWD